MKTLDKESKYILRVLFLVFLYPIIVAIVLNPFVSDEWAFLPFVGGIITMFFGFLRIIKDDK
ncbi:MAG: hypothetical protein COV70_00515 [Parcubacteria group bacterium CG11_big_fil_rev_8_21_14_0_20_39_22]|nr:MAG: hypothetical protein COV70_00515 [Parcubacteria group bacterium CG11_big_fil_rev_8_21_14_0_20_39_22]